MAYNYEFPYTDMNRFNCDWLLNEMKRLNSEFEKFVRENVIKFHDPILWDITTQYEKGVIVQDIHGNAYLSKQPIPSGILLENADYWLAVISFTTMFELIKQSISYNDEGSSPTATQIYERDELVWLNDELFIVLTDIAIGESFVEGVNVDQVSIEDYLHKLDQEVAEINANISSLKNKHPKMVAFGDSFGDYTRDYTPSKSWVFHLEKFLRCNEHFNYCKSGGGWLSDTDLNPHPSLYQQYESAKADVDANLYDPNEITHVFIMEGVNDILHSSQYPTISARITAFDEKVKALFPNATFYYCQNWGWNAIPNYVCDLYEFMRGELAGCGFTIIPYIETTLLSSPTNPAYVDRDDLTHPTSAGARLLAERIFCNLNGGDYDPLGDFVFHPYKDPTHTELGDEDAITVRCKRTGYTVHFWVDIKATYDNPFTITNGFLLSAYDSTDDTFIKRTPPVGIFGADSPAYNFHYHLQTFQDQAGNIYNGSDVTFGVCNLESNGLGMTINGLNVDILANCHMEFSVDLRGLFGNWS